MALFILAFFVRTFRIAQPSEVVFDEVHFGKNSKSVVYESLTFARRICSEIPQTHLLF